MGSNLSLSLQESYKQAAKSSRLLLTLTIAGLAVSILGVVCGKMGMWEMMGLNLAFMDIVMVALMLASLACVFLWEIHSAGKLGVYLRTLTTADLEALLLAPSDAGIWTAGVQAERTRREKQET